MDDRTRQLSVIICTASVDDWVKQEAARLGAQDVIMKTDVTIEALRLLIEKYVGA